MAASSSMAWLEELVGTSLESKSGEVATSSLAGKTIGFYFSAHWCGPCRRFTPKLAEFYEAHHSAKNFEIIFVSCDRSESEFQGYFAEHPWLAVKYSDASRIGFNGLLGSKFKVSGIPNLVLVDADGTKITSTAVQEIYSDATGDAFPYRPRPLSELLPTNLVRNDGSSARVGAGKYTLYYFSAHWCPPCKRFTPKLIEWYNKRKAAGQGDAEIVFVSSDRDLEGYNTYFADMPWLAVPFADRVTVGAPLSKALDVEGIPTLALFSPQGELVNKECVTAVASDKPFPFLPPNVVDIADGISVWGFDVNSAPAMIVFLENADDDDQDDVEAKLEELAADVKATYTSSGDPDASPELIFLTAKGNDEMAAQIKGLCKISLEGGIGLLILNMPQAGAYYTKILEDSEDPVDAVAAFANAFRTDPGSLQRQQVEK